MSSAIEVRVIELRRQNLFCGAIRIQHQLLREGIEPLPSVSGIYHAFKRSIASPRYIILFSAV